MPKLACLLAFLLGIGGVSHAQIAEPAVERPQNVILLISDGCGPASFTLAREFKRFKGQDGLALDPHLVGSASTWAADSRVTDSAASGTAMACGIKTNNGAIAVDTAGRPVPTILEASEARGMATGLVATSTISHATPAAFSAHVPNRIDQAEIARQQLEQGIEVLFAGGAAFFLLESEGGVRKDGLNLFAVATDKGYSIARNRAELLDLNAVPALGIFAHGQMSYEIERDRALEPSLEMMTRRAIDLLDDDPDGFFLMVEGSRIDHAAHGNDVAAHLYEILQFDAAFAAAIEFAERDGSTLVVSTSDHETGGMSLGRSIDGQSEYAWWPEVIDRVPGTVSGLVDMAREDSLGICPFLEQETEILCSESDRISVEEAEADTANPWATQTAVAEIISKAAGVGWTTHGHTGVDVNVYAYGPGSSYFRGHLDNTAIGKKIAAIMALDLASTGPALEMPKTE